MIHPREWVATSQLFAETAPALDDPERLAELHVRRAEFDPLPTLEKCVAEAIYESVRERLLPDAPSRLRCLFAALDAYAALEFAQLYLPPPDFDSTGMSQTGAIPVSTADGRWVVLDMHLFDVPDAIGQSRESTVNAIVEVEATAERYWRGEQSEEMFGEILAEKLWVYTAFISEGGLPPLYSEWRLGERPTGD